ncbi:hypothetical protein Bpro_4955 (plasmid) [Polaromonas sp. JS666]|nr:hypothetical protein Bpro_4955 [Polaromonas sp. JS666]
MPALAGRLHLPPHTTARAHPGDGRPQKSRIGFGELFSRHVSGSSVAVHWPKFVAQIDKVMNVTLALAERKVDVGENHRPDDLGSLAGMGFGFGSHRTHHFQLSWCEGFAISSLATSAASR